MAESKKTVKKSTKSTKSTKSKKSAGTKAAETQNGTALTPELLLEKLPGLLDLAKKKKNVLETY